MLRKRWTTVAGRELQTAVAGWLLGGRRPSGVAEHEGRADLRGLPTPTPSILKDLTTGGVSLQVVEGLLEARNLRWSALDLSHARLSSMRFFDCAIENCLFEGAACRDWRLWNSEVINCKFDGSDLRDAAIGTWHDGHSNVWRRVSFDGADLRGALLSGCLLSECTFRETRLSGAQFLQATIQDSLFAGPLSDVLFDGRDLPRKPVAGPMRNVDFSGTSFADVEFRGYRFDGVRLPDLPGLRMIPRYPETARRALALVADMATVEGRMFAAELRNYLKMPGAEDSVGVFNRADYVVDGGESLADLAETTWLDAQTDLGH